jgi:hypothetical protein
MASIEPVTNYARKAYFFLVVLYFKQYEFPMLCILTDGGTEYCGRVDRHDYQLYLAINDIDDTKTKAMSPTEIVLTDR